MKAVYEVGEIVKVRANTCDHSFLNGEHVRIRNLSEGGNVETAEHLDGRDFWYIDDEDICKLRNRND